MPAIAVAMPKIKKISAPTIPPMPIEVATHNVIIFFISKAFETNITYLYLIPSV